jgi:hypothetical protein
MGRRTRARDEESGEALTDVRGVRRPRIFEPAHVFSIGTAGDSRGSIISPDGATRPPQGRVLEPERPLSLFEEEVPRSGLAVSRAWQLARAPDGTTFAWIGRRKRPGRGEGSSGLAFDQLSEASDIAPAKG